MDRDRSDQIHRQFDQRVLVFEEDETVPHRREDDAVENWTMRYESLGWGSFEGGWEDVIGIWNM